LSKKNIEKNLQSQKNLLVYTKYLQDAHPQFLHFFSEKTFMKIWKMDIFEMSKTYIMGLFVYFFLRISKNNKLTPIKIK